MEAGKEVRERKEESGEKRRRRRKGKRVTSFPIVLRERRRRRRRRRVLLNRPTGYTIPRKLPTQATQPHFREPTHSLSSPFSYAGGGGGGWGQKM